MKPHIRRRALLQYLTTASILSALPASVVAELL